MWISCVTHIWMIIRNCQRQVEFWLSQSSWSCWRIIWWALKLLQQQHHILSSYVVIYMLKRCHCSSLKEIHNITTLSWICLVPAGVSADHWDSVRLLLYEYLFSGSNKQAVNFSDNETFSSACRSSLLLKTEVNIFNQNSSDLETMLHTKDPMSIFEQVMVSLTNSYINNTAKSQQMSYQGTSNNTVQFIKFKISPIHSFRANSKSVSYLRKPADCTETSLWSNPRPECARGDCEEKKLPFNRRKPPSEPEPGRAAICLDQLGAERTGKRGQQAP